MSGVKFGDAVGDGHAAFDRAMDLLADRAADFDATAKRCEQGGWPTLAIERRTEANAVRGALVDVLAAELVFEGTTAGEALAVAIDRADELIHAATDRRGQTAGAA